MATRHSTLLRAIDPLRPRLVVEVGRLFEREGRGTRLTDAGGVVAQHAAVVLSTLDSLHEELASLEGAQTGTLRIATRDEFGNYVLPGILAAFAADRPQIEIHEGCQ